MKKLPLAPKWAVQVRVPFHELVLSRACSVRTVWLLSRGAKTSPFCQSLILHRVREWRKTDQWGHKKYLKRLSDALLPVEYTVEIQYSCRMAAAGKDDIANVRHRSDDSAHDPTQRGVELHGFS